LYKRNKERKNENSEEKVGKTNLLCVCLCIVDDMRKDQLDATQ